MESVTPVAAPAHPSSAIRVVALLWGFYLLVTGMALGLLVVVGLLVQAGRFRPTHLGAILTALVLLRSLFVVDRLGSEGPVGIAAEARDRRLVELVMTTADQVGAPRPTEVRFVAEPNAFVSQRSHLLGLLGGPS